MSVTEDNISQRPLEDVLPESFLGYSKHVILQRALPDVRDGLKPVHRRILYSMDEMGMYTDKPYSKSARLVGDCMGKYHPHGDSSIYDSAVRMAQPWATRYPMVDGQGNFGSIDGDNAAAMRYTEMRMTPLSQLMTLDIEKNTVLFKENYDQRLKEPVVLPCPFPNLLVNGGSGIAVGMMSNIPPHNLREVIAGIISQIDHPQITIDELLKRVSGPDFPTGGLIVGTEGIVNAYKTGRGKVTIRGKVSVEQGKNGKSLIVISEVPYQVNKSNLAAKIETLADQGKVEGINEVRDESDREGIRLIVECRKEVDPLKVLRFLYKYTQLEETFGIINLVITAEGIPRILGLKEINAAFIQHRRIVVTKRTEFELEKARLKAHVLEGLVIAVNNLDEVIALIRSSKTPSQAKAGLIIRFELSEVQSQAILDMKLQNLTNFELEALKKDYADVLALMAELENILKDVNKIDYLIKKELKGIADKYGDERRTVILPEEMREHLDLSAFEGSENRFEIMLTQKGFIKRMTLSAKKKKVSSYVYTFKEGDSAAEIITGTDKDTLYFFTQSGTFHSIKAKLIPEAGKKDRGFPLAQFTSVSKSDNVVSVLSVKETVADEHCFVFVTKDGQVMRSPVSYFINVRSPEAIRLKEGDAVVKVFLSDNQGELFLASHKGLAIHFSVTEINLMSRKSRGVRGITLDEDWVVDALILNSSPETPQGDLVTVTERGFLKRTSIQEYKLQGRAGKGISIGEVSLEESGFLVGIMQAQDDDVFQVIQASGTVTKIEIKNVKIESRKKVGVQWVPVMLNDYVVRIV